MANKTLATITKVWLFSHTIIDVQYEILGTSINQFSYQL